MNGFSPQDKDLIVRTVIGEAGNEPADGQAAVAHVILNRLNSGNYGDGVSGVLLKPKQFEPWSNPQKMMSYSPDSPAYQKASNIVDGVISGNIDDPTNGATHFANVDTVQARGNNSAMNWIKGMTNVSQIGSHTFGNADGPPKMAQNDSLKGVDLNALDQKYGGDSATSASDKPYYTPPQNGQPAKLTINAQGKNNPLAGVDLNSLDAKYAGTADAGTQAQSDTSNKEWWQNANDTQGIAGVGERLGIGALRGMKDVLDTGAHGLGNAASYVAGKVLPESLAQPIQQSVVQSQAEDLANRNKFNATYPDSTAIDVGRVGGQIAATAPLMPVKAFQAIGAGAKALPIIAATGEKVAAPLINRLGAAVGQGALGGGIFGGATSSANDKSLAENVGSGAITGAIAGPVLPVAGDLAKGIGGKIVGKISNTTAQLAKRAEELGIPLKATQVSNSPLLKKYDQISGMLPFSGAQNISNNQTSAFTRAVSKTFGENTDEITPKVIQAARQRIGGDIENVGKNATIKADTQLHNDLKQVVTDARGTMTDAELRPVAQNIQNIIDKIDASGNINGEAYTALTNYKGVLSKAQSNSNPNIRNAANEIRSALDDALTRSISPDQKAALLKARGQYKAVMTIKDLAEADEHGNVSPLRLMQKVMKSPGGKLRSGDLGEIADIGRAFFKNPADSGTPLGEAVMQNVVPFIHSPFSALTAGASALASGATFGTVGEGALGLAANRLIRSGVNSNAARRALIRSGTGETHGAINKLANAVVPYSAALAPPRNQLKLTDQNSR